MVSGGFCVLLKHICVPKRPLCLRPCFICCFPPMPFCLFPLPSMPPSSLMLLHCFLFYVCDSLDPYCFGLGRLLESSKELAILWGMDGSSMPNPTQRHICTTGFCCAHSILPPKNAHKDYYDLFICCPHVSNLSKGNQ